ncbi:ATP-dependent helicase [Candidatus Saganbacteria bacterium]|nr:ATP-dependent helicase [Candidatus Saganbacteria bacterium]
MPQIKTHATKKDILSGLNPEQKKAVVHKTGPLLIIAGAGTGKTTVLTRRIAYLISSKLAKPGEILALTFTDKAANEMESRVDVLVPYGYIDVALATFHAFGDRVLRDYAINLGLRPDYRILSHADQIVFFREHWHDFPLKHFKSLSDPVRHIEALIKIISRAKDEDISPEEYLKWARREMRDARCDETEKQLEIAHIYKKYQYLKMEKGFVDFGDQVNLVLKLFREHPAVLKKFQDRYKFILVDEFQDTNLAQFELLKLLAKKNNNITVVGDDDQSIYKFRGAAISNILQFEKVYKKCKKVVLVSNYRSTQLILDTSYRLIKHNNPDRLEVRSKIDKKLISALEPANKLRGSNEFRNRGVQPQVPLLKKVKHLHFDSVLSEADWVAKYIKEKFDAGEYNLKDFAILVRSNSTAKPFCQSLNLLGIPYLFSGGGGLYVLPEVKLSVSFLRVIGDLSDNISLYDLAISPVYRLSPLDMQKIGTYIKRRNATIHNVFSTIDQVRLQGSESSVLSDISDGSIIIIKKIMEDVSWYLEFSKDHTTGEVLYQFLKRSKYLESLTAVESLENDAKLRNIAKFFNKVREFHEIVEIDRVSEFVKYLNLLKDAGEDPEASQPDSDIDAVSVLTIHKAKGLEFPVVFMVSLVSEKFPTRARSEVIELPQTLIKEYVPTGDVHLQEERRLFYVGMTRAKSELFLTSAVDYGGKRERKVSQFVMESLDLPKADVAPQKKKPIDQIELFAPQETALFPIKKIVDDEILSLSYYPIDDYLTCPLTYYSSKLNSQKFSEKGLIDVFLNNWSSEGFISRQHEEARLAGGKDALKRFFKEQKRSKADVMFVEEEFKIIRDRIQIKGRWDLVLENRISHPAFRISIVDFKSTEVKTQEDADKRAKESIQLSI